MTPGPALPSRPCLRSNGLEQAIISYGWQTLPIDGMRVFRFWIADWGLGIVSIWDCLDFGLRLESAWRIGQAHSVRIFRNIGITGLHALRQARCALHRASRFQYLASRRDFTDMAGGGDFVVEFAFGLHHFFLVFKPPFFFKFFQGFAFFHDRD